MMCDFGAYNTDACGYDGGDCIEINARYGKCTLEYPNWAGNTICWDNWYVNYTVDDPSSVGNGWCNGGKYMSPECGYAPKSHAMLPMCSGCGILQSGYF